MSYQAKRCKLSSADAQAIPARRPRTGTLHGLKKNTRPTYLCPKVFFTRDRHFFGFPIPPVTMPLPAPPFVPSAAIFSNTPSLPSPAIISSSLARSVMYR